MYTGAYHMGCLKFALSLVPSNQILILSAKYGLLRLTDWIEPYNLKMGEKGCVTAEAVRQQALDMGLLDEQVCAIGGRSYTDICRVVWPTASTPLDGVGGMGRQLAWLSRHRGISVPNQ
jgi:hypothetical protein